MATPLITVGTATEASQDFALAANAAATLFISCPTGIPPGCRATIEIKATGLSTYQRIGFLSADNPIAVLQAQGTFRVVRKGPAPVPFGVDIEQ